MRVRVGSKGMAPETLEIETGDGKGLNAVTGTTPRLIWGPNQIRGHSFRGKEARRDHGLPQAGA
jgi:hypothetical protein